MFVAVVFLAACQNEFVTFTIQTLEPSPAFTATAKLSPMRTSTVKPNPKSTTRPNTAVIVTPKFSIDSATRAELTPASTPTLTITSVRSPTPDPTPTATAEAQVDLSDPLFIESLRRYRNASPAAIEIVTIITVTNHFTRYQIAYPSEGQQVTGIMNVPRQQSTGNRTGSAMITPARWPVILLNHGHFDPAVYHPGTGTQLEADYLAPARLRDDCQRLPGLRRL